MRAGSRFLVPVQLADFDLCPDVGTGHIHPRQCDRLAQQRRAHGGRHLAHLRAPDMNAVAMANLCIAVYVQAHQLAGRVFLAPDQRVAADEILGFGFQRHGKTDARFEWVGLVAEIIACKDQSGFDPHHVQRIQP